MAIPPVSLFSNQPGGGIAYAQKGLNELTTSRLNNIMKELQNKYYGPNIESEIASRQASTEGQNIFNQYAPDKYRLANELSKENLEQLKKTNPLAYEQLILKNKQSEQTNALMNMILRGGAISPQPEQPNNISVIPQGQATPPSLSNNEQYDNNSLYSNQNTTPNLTKQQVTAGTSGITYPQAAMMNKLLGLSEPKIIDVNGQKIAVTPYGNIPVAQGLTPSQEAYEKGKGKYGAESYGANVDTYKSLTAQDVALDEMISALDNPEFYNVTGPISSKLKNWLGTPEQQQLLGSLRTASGEIALQVAPSLKGAFTGRDQSLLNTIKANPDTDFPDVFIGKLKAQKLIGSVLKERNRLAAAYKDKGMPPLQAEERAAKETPLWKYKSEIDKLIKHHENRGRHEVVRVKSPNGRIAKGTKEQIGKFLKEHPDWKKI